MREKPKTIPTIIGVFVLIFGVVAGVVATQYKAIFRLGAQNQPTPKNIRITNVTSSSATISWTTDQPTTSFVSWGKSQSFGELTQQSQGTLHYFNLDNLDTGSDYYFKVNSGGIDFDNNGTAWKFKTASQTSSNNPTVISGQILNEDNSTAQAIVYVNDGTGPKSAKTSETGNWVIPLDQVNQDTLLQIAVVGANGSESSAQAYVRNSQPTPNIILGQTFDFKEATTQQSSDLPEATIDIPQDSSAGSGFDFLTEEDPLVTVQQGSANSVTLESIEEGEIINTQVPEFFGEAPAGVTLSITVESDPINAEVVSQGGVWSWNLPSQLEEGAHKITIKWIDADGILRTLTRSFVVSAADGPAFVASGSASIAPSATPISQSTPTPVAVVTPTATAVATPFSTPTLAPTSSPRVSYPSTESGTPVAGSLTPTIVLSIMGLGLFGLAFYVSRKAI